MENKLYGYFVNDILLEGPKPLPTIFVNQNGDTITGFNLMFKDINSLNNINDYNWYEVDNSCLNISYNSIFEDVVYSSWRLEDNILKRDYTFLYNSFEIALTKCFKILDTNREKYEVSGFVYNYYGTNVRILTDKESSQGKLTASQICANNGTRSDNDVWKFIKEDDHSTIVVQLSNEDLNNICNFVFRQIQDSYNLTSQIAWQMLNCGSTETLKNEVESGNINLNPWNII